MNIKKIKFIFLSYMKTTFFKVWRREKKMSEIFRTGKWSQTPCYGVWLYDNANGPFARSLIESAAGCPVDPETGGVDFEEAGLCLFKKISFWFRWPEGVSRPREEVEKILLSLRKKYFSEGKGWDFSSAVLEFALGWEEVVSGDYRSPETPVQAPTLMVGKTKSSPLFSEEEKKDLLRIAEEMSKVFFSL